MNLNFGRMFQQKRHGKFKGSPIKNIVKVNVCERYIVCNFGTLYAFTGNLTAE